MDEAGPPDLDRDLWVIASGFEGRCYLLGNGHSLPGRMAIWSEALGQSANISLADISDASPEAHRWVEGFLHGNEPTAAEFLGVDPGRVAELDDDDEAFGRWRTALDAFHEKGWLPALVPVPTAPFPAALAFGHTPWLWAGGQVWQWDRTAWVVPDPQPELDGQLLAGSVCAERLYHDMEQVGDAHTACTDCGDVTELEPQELRGGLAGSGSPD